MSMKTLPFRHKDVDYEVRCISDGYTIHIRAFRGKVPANGYAYSLTHPMAFDIANVRGVDAIEDLIEEAKNDVIEENWERYLKAVEEYEKAEKNA